MSAIDASIGSICQNLHNAMSVKNQYEPILDGRLASSQHSLNSFQLELQERSFHQLPSDVCVKIYRKMESLGWAVPVEEKQSETHSKIFDHPKELNVAIGQVAKEMFASMSQDQKRQVYSYLANLFHFPNFGPNHIKFCWDKAEQRESFEPARFVLYAMSKVDKQDAQKDSNAALPIFQRAVMDCLKHDLDNFIEVDFVDVKVEPSPLPNLSKLMEQPSLAEASKKPQANPSSGFWSSVGSFFKK